MENFFLSAKFARSAGRKVGELSIAGFGPLISQITQIHPYLQICAIGGKKKPANYLVQVSTADFTDDADLFLIQNLPEENPIFNHVAKFQLSLQAIPI